MYPSSLFCHDSSLATFLKLLYRNNPSLQSPEVSTRYHGITNDFCNENILVVHIYPTHRSISKCLPVLLNCQTDEESIGHLLTVDIGIYVSLTTKQVDLALLPDRSLAGQW
jgi:hypothetical protein